MACEDYPCCGHGTLNGVPDCPDSKGRFKCVECGKKLSKAVTSSICDSCMRRARKRFVQTGEMFPDRDY